MSAESHAVDMTLYRDTHHPHAISRQLNTSIEPTYSQAPAADNLHTPLHHFLGAAQSNRQGGHGRGLDVGYSDPSFSPGRTPQFGFRTAQQYPLLGGTSLDPLGLQANVPPNFGHQPLGRNFSVAGSADQQQVQFVAPAGEHGDGHHRLDIRQTGLSQGAQLEETPEQPIFNESDDLAIHPKSSKKPRARFSDEARRETGATRKTGACIRCRIQRSRCIPDPSDPRGECTTCRAVQKHSRKVVHKLPCLRYKITEITVSRTDDPRGALQLTKRWRGFEMKDISDWVNATTRTIQLSLGVCSRPITVIVRKFRPAPGDVTSRYWRDGNITKQTDLEPYALASIRQSAKDVTTYFNENAVQALLAISKDNGVSEIIRETYLRAVQHYESLYVPELDDSHQKEEWQFLKDVFRLWVAVRHTAGSSYICGDDKLDMEPKSDDKSYPLWGRVSTPRMIIAQIDSINAKHIIPPLRRKVLKSLDLRIKANKTQDWFTIYIAIFLHLHTVSIISADRRRHGKANGATKGYSLPGFVEDLHESANILLAFWHYYRTDEDPLEVECIDRHRSRLVDLGAEQFSFVKKSCAVMREKREEFRNAVNWDEEHYWTCRMFDMDWSAGESFKS